MAAAKKKVPSSHLRHSGILCKRRRCSPNPAAAFSTNPPASHLSPFEPFEPFGTLWTFDRFGFVFGFGFGVGAQLDINSTLQAQDAIEANRKAGKSV